MDTPLAHANVIGRRSLFVSPECPDEVETVRSEDLPGFSTPLIHFQDRNNQKRSRKLVWSPIKRVTTPVKSPPKKKVKESWTNVETKCLVEFIALHKDLQPSDSEWPGMRSEHTYWSTASDYIKTNVGTNRSGASCRTHVSKFLKPKFTTIDQAETHFDINYTDSTIDDSGFRSRDKENFTRTPRYERTNNEKNVSTNIVIEDIQNNFKQLSLEDKKSVLDGLFKNTCISSEIRVPPTQFPSMAIKAMKNLEDKEKPNLLHNFARCLGETRPDSSDTLMPVDRMPFGLIQFQIQFFSSKNAKQIQIPDDYYKWLETLDAEFEDRLGRLIRGPMWSGMDNEDIGDPIKARVNLAAVSKRTIQRRTADTEFSTSPKIQIPAIQTLKEVNPNGRYWIKLDGTDLKESLQHSVKDVWNGDVDLNDGQLDELRSTYETRLSDIKCTSENMDKIDKEIKNLEDDQQFLQKQFNAASVELRKKISIKNSNSETLKNLNWEVVESNTLLQKCVELLSKLKTETNPRKYIKTVQSDYLAYLKNLFKKKRIAATHILVIELSDEQRNKKPYALPVQYLPYKSLRDQYIRDITGPIKEAMVNEGLNVVGQVTDGEFNSLRTQGDTGPLHIWQLVHDAKEAVRKMSKATLEAMLTYAGDDENGRPYAEIPSAYVPPEVLIETVDMLNEGLTFEDAITFLRRKLVPDGYDPYPFRRDTPESFIDQLRSLIATYLYRFTVSELKEEGRDFTQHLYVPEIDKTTGNQFHERGDHNHILKRIATSTRECRYPDLNPDAFDQAMLDPQAGLSHAALTGQRPQSVDDAEKLLSFHVAASLERNGFDFESEYVSTVAAWHEASDGRGISQLQRCKANYQMLNYLVDELMPWHRDCYDFSYIDVNRPMDNIRGFTRETFVEITTNIESQELRRQQIADLQYPENPRAATTDDVECFFSLTRRHLGDTFTLQDFKNQWPKLVREFCKRMDPDLPFYYWTRNERFKEEEDSFDVPTEVRRLHTVRHSQREDCNVFTAGRAFLPARNKQSIRQRLFRVDVGLPPVPEQGRA